MNLKNLEYFVKIVEEGSITRAASSMRMTQPALSRQIRVFEDEMGWKLFERGAKTIELTHAGEVVLREGKKMLEGVRRGMMQIKREVDGGVIRIGYAPSLAGDLLKRAMSCFVQRHPNVNIQLLDSSSEEMRKGLLDGKLDLKDPYAIANVSHKKNLNNFLYCTFIIIYTFPLALSCLGTCCLLY